MLPVDSAHLPCLSALVLTFGQCHHFAAKQQHNHDSRYKQSSATGILLRGDYAESKSKPVSNENVKPH